MNSMIDSLEKMKKEKEELIEREKSELKNIKSHLGKEIFVEENLLNMILHDNLCEMVDIIHKGGLEFESIENDRSHVVYRVRLKDSIAYRTNIKVKNGKIIVNDDGIDNYGCGKELHEKARYIVTHKIIPFCDNLKPKYDKEVYKIRNSDNFWMIDYDRYEEKR